MTKQQTKFKELKQRYKKAFKIVNGYDVKIWFEDNLVWVYSSMWSLPNDYDLNKFQEMTETLEKQLNNE